MAEVPIVKISYTDRGRFARDVYSAAIYNGLSPEAAIVLTAHVAGSTGWGKAVDNWRLAGMKADATWRASKDYTVVSGCECVEGYDNVYDGSCECDTGYGQRYSKMYWRSFPDLNASMASLLSLLQQSRYASAYALLLQGDPEYLAEVGRNGWYTASPDKVKSGYSAHIPKIREYVGQAEVAAEDGDSGGLGVAGIIAVAAGGYVLYKLITRGRA
jgi:hypothetical protein